jgi:hypothetical protein
MHPQGRAASWAQTQYRKLAAPPPPPPETSRGYTRSRGAPLRSFKNSPRRSALQKSVNPVCLKPIAGARTATECATEPRKQPDGEHCLSRARGYEQLRQVTQVTQSVDVELVAAQIWTPGAPEPATVQSLTSCSMQRQLTLVVSSFETHTDAERLAGNMMWIEHLRAGLPILQSLFEPRLRPPQGSMACFTDPTFHPPRHCPKPLQRCIAPGKA